MDFVAGRALGNDVALADETRGRHAERLEDTLAEKFGVRFSGDFMNDDAKQNVVRIAVVPLVAGCPFDRESLNVGDEFVLGEIEAKIEGAFGADALAGFVFRESRSVG